MLQWAALYMTVLQWAALYLLCCRGQHFFGTGNHEVDSLRAMRPLEAPELPVGGWFGNGEIGPIAERTFMHQFTSVFALFRPSETSARQVVQRNSWVAQLKAVPQVHGDETLVDMQAEV